MCNRNIAKKIMTLFLKTDKIIMLHVRNNTTGKIAMHVRHAILCTTLTSFAE